jgi:hypothetical protein
MGVADLRTQSPPLAITLGEIKGRTIPRRLRPKTTLNQSLRSNFSAEHAMAVGWTVAATAGANRSPLPSANLSERTIPRRLRPKATANQSLRSNFSAKHAMAVGWTVAATEPPVSSLRLDYQATLHADAQEEHVPTKYAYRRHPIEPKHPPVSPSDGARSGQYHL